MEVGEIDEISEICIGDSLNADTVIVEKVEE